MVGHVSDIYRIFTATTVSFSYQLENYSPGGKIFLLIKDEAAVLTAAEVKNSIAAIGTDDTICGLELSQDDENFHTVELTCDFFRV